MARPGSRAWEAAEADAERHAADERRHHRDERRRRERARLRRQRLSITVTVATLTLSCACCGMGRLLMPAAAEPRRVAAITPESDGAAASIAAAMRLRKVAPKALKPKPKRLTALEPAPGVRTIVVDKGDQTTTLYESSGKPVARYVCSTGVYYPKTGTYEVFGHKPESWYPADGSHFFHFTMFTKSEKGTNIGFHSLPTDADGQEAGGLGKPISHGCVRLASKNAEYLYGWAEVGTKVIVQQ